MATGLAERAVATIRANDRGSYTVPTKGLYPFQWNWDSAFAALGFASFDRDRAWTELETLFASQWDNGMVPHIVFWQDDDGYFPGKDVWGSGTKPASSGHSQPPVAASVALRLVESGDGKDMERARALFPDMLAWHRWYHSRRDPDGMGLVAITHPWESGRDNSPEWDAPLAAVEVDAGIGDYRRKDLDFVDATDRPTKEQYDRFLTLVKFGRDCGWDADAIYRDGPFLVADPGVQFILLRADRDLCALAALLGERGAMRELNGWIGGAVGGSERLWNPDAGCYCALDLRSGARSSTMSSASMLAWYAGLWEMDRLAGMADKAREILGRVKYGMPSWDPGDPGFEPRRYWRGPVWAIMNHMIAQGLAERGEDDLAQRVRGDTVELVCERGFREYYDPLTGDGCGGGDFTWTAAVGLDLGSGEDAG